VPLASVPVLLHGPIPYKFNILGINGAIAVWASYSARLSIGFVVGITRWPASWYLAGRSAGRRDVPGHAGCPRHTRLRAR